MSSSPNPNHKQPQQGVIRVGTCPKCKGSQMREHDSYGYIWHCINCGTDEFDPTPVKKPPERPYDSMDQQKFEGFSCGISEECLTCPLQRCENLWFKHLVHQATQPQRPGRISLLDPHAAARLSIPLTQNNKEILQDFRWLHQPPPAPRPTPAATAPP